MIEICWYIVFFAFILDLVLGDPSFLPHPIVYMGKAISFFENPFRKTISHPLLSGSFFALFLIASTALISFGFIKLTMNIHPVLGDLVQTILLFFSFSSKSLKQAALAVYRALKENNLSKARKKVGMIVGRQTHELDEPAITRATVETVAENFVDGFLSPLFFACIGGVPLALAYKMVNTLDSMVGYKNETYLLFGRTAAKIDDAANFIPARLSVPVIALATALLSLKKAKLSLKTGFSQGRYHKSPNAGYPEAAFAGSLEIRLGGPSIYHGTLVEKPFIGSEFNNPAPVKIKHACDLMILSSLISVLIACFILFLF